MNRLRYLFFLACRSAWNRRYTLLLIVCSIALSATLMLGIERLRTQVKDSFMQSISGTDLVVGARGGSSQLLLYAVFHMGGATNNMGYDSAQYIQAMPEVAWTVPVSLGDSHRGYPVVATNEDFLKHYSFRGNEHLSLESGSWFSGLFDVVLGSEVAEHLHYALGQKVVLSHGNSGTHLTEHSDMPFQVSGILKPTGTTADRSLYISLEAMEAIHVTWRGGAPLPGIHLTPEQVEHFNLQPKVITAMLVGLKQRTQVFAVQRAINNYTGEPLSAVLPGVVLDQIWQTLNTGENALLVVSVLASLAGLLGLCATLLAGLNERRRELAILRSAGARPADIVLLIGCEVFILLVLGLVCGFVCLYLLTAAAAPVLLTHYGIFIHATAISAAEWKIAGGILLAGMIAGLLPAIRAYRMSLNDGLSVRL